MLWKTDEVRGRKMTVVVDEIDTGLFYFPLSLFQSTAQVYRNFERSLVDVYGEDVAQQMRIPSFLQFGSWIGGDRDGNPNVTPETTVLGVTLAITNRLTRIYSPLGYFAGPIFTFLRFLRIAR